MEFTYEMGFLGAALLIVAAVVLGVSIFLVGRANSGYEWIATAIAALVGGFAASEFVIGFRNWEPVFDGLALVPAAIGAVVAAVVVAVAVRFITTGTVDTRATA